MKDAEKSCFLKEVSRYIERIGILRTIVDSLEMHWLNELNFKFVKSCL